MNKAKEIKKLNEFKGKYKYLNVNLVKENKVINNINEQILLKLILDEYYQNKNNNNKLNKIRK